MFLSAYFTTGRIIFMIFFIVAFIALMIYSYRKDLNNHKRYYKNAGKKVLIYGGLTVIIFMAIRFFTTR
jgi:preprotein translocase subunit YajC